MKEQKNKNLFVIIDSNSIIHRAYHALPPFKTKEGDLVNAVYGFFSIFLKTVRELRPDFIAAAFDLPFPTFRHQEFPEYKAKRVKAPDEFYQQIPRIKEILADFKVPIFEKKGLEADDIIGSLVALTKKVRLSPDPDIVILSSDNDLLQLVGEGVKTMILKKGVSATVLYDREKVKEKYGGLGPEQLVDFKALRGDPSDNIPGVRGIGEKTALKLLNQFQSFENLYSSLDKGELKKALIPESVCRKLEDSREIAFSSQRLARIRPDETIEFSLENCRWSGYDRGKVEEDFRKLQFLSLLPRLPGP